MSSRAGKYADAELVLVPQPQIDAVYAKVARRLVPFLFVCYLFSFIDRSNVGFAQLQMKSSLGFSDAAYGIGATMFFVGYALFEVPSNLLLQRIGARATLFRIMVLWGAASAATMFVRTPAQFYLLRFLLGVFEAGFFPGIVLYLTYWFPSNRRARVIALILMASVAAGFVTGPVSGVILKSLHEAGGLEGWQWMFVLEGLPTMLAAGFVFVLLPDRPEQAAWLDDAEKALIRDALAESGEPREPRSLLRVLSDPRAYLLAFGIFVNGCAGYFLAFWVPTLIRELGVADPRAIGLYTVIPNGFGIVAMLVYGRHSDRRNEQRLHWALAFVVAALGFVALGRTVQHSLPWTIAALAFGGSALVSSTPIFWAMATRYFPKGRAAAGIAFVNSLASLSGASPALVGLVKAHTGSLVPAIDAMAAMLVVAALALGYGMRDALPAAARGPNGTRGPHGPHAR
ncbi:MFS transporter [Burkholderia multivorans]|uniref:MFS transporter n=1 Tax=Burkholderia multivorans TaxID=87883 RepID=UPI0012DFCA08|nr:MFS transporter [Burkholderia multivorans]MBU9236160.1 MFS transporter [Burkholderia multivorans]QGR92667.1 MFS transporter [Burkholderia multivorans]HEF4738110.1 MFS transporter [Burkholderia multivorans]